MVATLFLLPFRPAFDANAIVVPQAKLYFYSAGTSTLTTVYADEALTTPLQNPISANAAGVWPSIFLDDNTHYRVVLKDAVGVTINEVDPYLPNTIDGLTTDIQDLVDIAVAAGDSAEVDANRAQGYATAIETVTGGYWYPSLADGVADTTNGESFLVVTDEGRIQIGYNNGAGGIIRAEFLTPKAIENFPENPSEFLAALSLSADVNTLLQSDDNANIRESIGAQQATASAAAIAALTPASDKLPYYTGDTTASLATLTSFIRPLLASEDAASARTVLGASASPTISGTAASGSIRLGNAIFAWRDASVSGNTYTTVLHGDGVEYVEFAKCWFNGGATASGAQDNNPFVAVSGLTSASVYNSVDGSISGTLFSFGK